MEIRLANKGKDCFPGLETVEAMEQYHKHTVLDFVGKFLIVYAETDKTSISGGIKYESTRFYPCNSVGSDRMDRFFLDNGDP